MVRGDHLAKLTVNFFAEFLEPPLPVCLSLLDLLTCVGYRYGYKYFFVHVLFPEAHVWKLDYILRCDLTLVARAQREKFLIDLISNF